MRVVYLAIRMSLAKTLAQATGNDATYWQIGDVYINPRGKQIRVVIYGFKDKATFDAGGQKMGTYGFDVDQTLLQSLGNTTTVPAIKSLLEELQAIAKLVVSDLSDATVDDTDVI